MTFVHIEAPALPKIKQENNALTGKRWYVTPEGNRYPSVTTILGDGEKPWLQNWKNMLGENNAAKETKRCSDRGSAIHKLIEGYLNNEQDFTKGNKQEYVNGFNQLKMFLNRITNIRHQETGVYSDALRIAGTVDCIGDFQSKLSLIDFKTSTNPKKSDMIEDYRLQCTAYALCYFEQTGIFIEDYAILISVEKGLLPQMFVGSIKDHVSALNARVKTFHNAHKS